MLGHPTGRLLLAREGYAVDLDAVIAAAARAGTMIEINANPHRLDLDWIHARASVAWRADCDQSRCPFHQGTARPRLRSGNRPQGGAFGGTDLQCVEPKHGAQKLKEMRSATNQ